MSRFRALREQGITWEHFAFQFIIVLVGVWLAIVIGDREPIGAFPRHWSDSWALFRRRKLQFGTT